MKRLEKWLPPLFLLGLCGLAYALWAPRMGIYWDDFPIGWIARTYGSAGLERYFSTNRPFWGLLYRLTTPLFDTQPLAWQATAILMRWLSGLALWGLLKLVWPRRADFAIWAAAIFVVYPGFSQQFIPLLYTHFFIVLNFFLFSLLLNLLALRRPRLFWPLSAAAWLLSLANLLSMEYFFFLDLVRPLLIWIVLGDLPAEAKSSRLKRSLSLWAPYLVLFVGVIVWRTFFFGFHTYQPALAARLKSEPLAALLQLAGRVAGDAWLTTFAAWGNAFHIPGAEEMTSRLQLGLAGVVAGGIALALVYAFLSRRQAAEDPPARGWFYAPILTGGLALLVGGAPFWLTDLPLSLSFQADRFTLSFMLGAVLVVVGLVFLPPLPRWARVVPLAVLVGFACGAQFQNSVSYVRDWNVQKRFFWQMAWRIPALQPGTTLLFNELPVLHYSDNSLTAPLNWIYAPENRTQRMSYVLYYPTVRLGDNLPGLQKGLPFELNYLAATFYGNTSQVVAFYFNPPGCLRVLDPEVEIENFVVPSYLRQAMVLSSPAPILPQGEPSLPERLFGSEPERGWCYYFEKADLARQEKDWQQVARLGDTAFGLADYPNDPAERLVFIEGYAHTGNWQKARELTDLSARISPVAQNMACRLWARIRREVPPGADGDAAIAAVWSDYHCDQLEGIPK